MNNSSTETYLLSPPFLWGKIQDPYPHIQTFMRGSLSHLLISLLLSHVPPPELDHCLLSLHILAHDSHSAWMSPFPRVCLAKARCPCQTRLQHHILRCKPDSSRPPRSLHQSPIAPVCNPLLLRWFPVLSLEILLHRQSLCSSDERVNNCFSASINWRLTMLNSSHSHLI